MNVFLVLEKKINGDFLIISREDLPPTLRRGKLVLKQKITIRDKHRQKIEGSIVFMREFFLIKFSLLHALSSVCHVLQILIEIFVNDKRSCWLRRNRLDLILIIAIAHHLHTNQDLGSLLAIHHRQQRIRKKTVISQRRVKMHQ